MIRVLIVDDERLARTELRRLLSAHAHVAIVGEADNAVLALEQIVVQAPDLVFVDIQMPGMDGLALAAEITGRVQFAFCTAFDSFAIDAFDLNAVDYLLKPVLPERLDDTLRRVRIQTTPGSVLPYDHGLLLKFGERARIVRLREIDRFHAVGNHAQVFTPHGRSFLHRSLSRIESRLDPAYFFRVSRSDILRLDAIAMIDPEVGGGHVATLHDGSRVEVSRRPAQQLRARMGNLN